MLSRVCFLLTLSHTIPSLASALQAACRSLCLAVPLLGGVQRCSVAMARLLLACWMQSEVVAAPPSHAATRRGTGALQPGGSGHLMPPSVSPRVRLCPDLSEVCGGCCKAQPVPPAFLHRHQILTYMWQVQ